MSFAIAGVYVDRQLRTSTVLLSFGLHISRVHLENEHFSVLSATVRQNVFLWQTSHQNVVFDAVHWETCRPSEGSFMSFAIACYVENERRIKMIKVNAIGDVCPIPVVKAKKAMEELQGAGEVEILVDNEIAVQNLTRLGKQKGCGVSAEKLEEKQYRVVFSVGEDSAKTGGTEAGAKEQESCIPDQRRKNTMVVISSDQMGTGDEALGAILIKGFIYALTQQDELPATILFYNGGARLTCEDAPTLEDLKLLEAQGVEILTCGTCLNHYGLSEKLKVGSVTNMYVIAEKMTQADLIVKP